ncbi:GroES-like protein [Cylindrobasidium torrendii FP15055 ss-10]|uniref:GroES-like protein n=1 Tax=Cylindrobasidium torrendii FP15055 ss-10 TaxID=1314674 RepID=A0A0D7B319_9AGAR|nr:GroES-like protein [Cylindrobasidium torrendii FP15055 ss-10]
MSMKAVVYTGSSLPSIEERPKPQLLKPTDAIVKMIKASICGTDLHILKGDVPTCAKGTILGHEGLAVVESVGASVNAVKPGDRVVISAITACSSCKFCRKGMPSHCVDGGWILGNTIDGLQAEYARIPHANASLHLAVPGASDADLVMISDVLPTSLECGVQLGKVEPGKTVAVVGAGPVGLGVVLNAGTTTCLLCWRLTDLPRGLYSPSKIIVIDLDENRLQQALQVGATHIIKSGPGAVERVMELTDGEGVDAAIEVVGVGATFKLCQDIVAVGGTIANLGVHGSKVDLHLERLWDHNITITTRLVDTVSCPLLLRLAESGRLRAGNLATHTYKFSEVLNGAYGTFSAAAQHNALKVLIDFE